MTKVVGIDKNKKLEGPCPYCGADPKCPDLTCLRVLRYELAEDGSLAAIEFFERDKWQRPKEPA